ncbi:MAG: DNA recombination protein RmuC [Bdellovibrionota bacterium]
MQVLLGLSIGLVLGGLIAYLFARAKSQALETTLALEKKASDEKLAQLVEAEKKLSDAFKALSAEALHTNNQAFLNLAKATLEKYQAEAKGDLEQRQKAVEHLVTPLKESLTKMGSQIEVLEKSRSEAYGALKQQVGSLLESQQKLQGETANLVKALRAPQTRGRWGEVQLKRVVELAGMTAHCDFYEQVSVRTEDGRMRPDMIVKLPGGKQIVVDAKAPLLAYLEALETSDDAQRLKKLQEHTQQVHGHVKALSEKAYWDQFDSTPEFVVLFLPGEAFLAAALEHEPSLIEIAAERKIILATPTNLIALLKAVYYGWRQEQVAENAQRVSDLGRELHERIATMVDHIGDVGKNLTRSVESYNKAVGSLETRVLSSARKLKELGAGSKKEIEELSPVESAARGVEIEGK